MLLAVNIDEIVFWLAIAALAIVSPIIGSMIAGRLAEPVRVKITDLSRGVARLWFRNPRVPEEIVASARAKA